MCLVASAPRRTASCAKLKQDQFAWKVVLTLDPEIASPRNLLMEEFKFEANVSQVSHWQALRNMIRTSAGRANASQPPWDEFADALRTIFWGNEFFLFDRPH